MFTVEIIELVNGTMLIMVNGYTFHRNGAKRRGGIRWCCSNKSRGCTAYMVVDEDRSIVDRLAVRKIVGGIFSIKGNKKVLICRNFVYTEVKESENVTRWKCKNSQCPAFILMDTAQNKNRISQEYVNHNHETNASWVDNKIRFNIQL
uniref:SFRICE_008142 n=1 Tax=Spodoptera frugiperda TaxID=7108 RepID=A0A2H1V2H4_SPOFR